MKIWAHTIVMNEDRYVWFAVMSILPLVDKILIWDTGSTDRTPQIIRKIKALYPEKVELNFVGEVNIFRYTQVRQKMLEETKSDWVMIADGDEIWWDEKIKNAIDMIRLTPDQNCLVTPFYNLIGDIYHHQDDSAGRYRIGDRSGHLNIRFINRNIRGLHFDKPHGQQGLFDQKGIAVQDLDPRKRIMLDDKYYLHFTNLSRSGSSNGDKAVNKRARKIKKEIGHPFPLDFYYPEVLFRPSPPEVASPWIAMSIKEFFIASVETPLRLAKRRLLPGKIGY